MSKLPFFALACFSALAATALADDITHTASLGPIAVGASGTVNAPAFDPALGVLRLVRVSVFGEVSGTWSVENTAAHPDGVGGYASGEYVGAYLPVTLPAGFMFAPNPAFVPDPSVPLAAFDGVLDFAGPSATSFTFANESGDGAPGQYADVYMDAGLQAYAGTAPITIGIGPVSQIGPNVPPWFQNAVTLSAQASISVRYTYDPFPARICRGAPFSGCPCSNATSTGTGGCGNSAGSAGGVLDAGGTASLSTDTLVLAGSAMTSSSALYFQGTTVAYAQSVYGDGLRCVGGSVVRLGTKVNSAGSSQYPEAGDAPVSVRGGVTMPGPRYYQVVYRDGGSFCTPSLFNATSGMAVLWTP